MVARTRSASSTSTTAASSGTTRPTRSIPRAACRHGAAEQVDAAATRQRGVPADVETERSVRFILFNNEETGGGAAAYVRQRAPLQGVENPAGSGKYPEPKWLGMIQHDMMLWDHGMPGPDGQVSAEQRREADVN